MGQYNDSRHALSSAMTTKLKGFDYNETFALVAKMASVQCFLLVVVSKGWGLHQLDVNNAFLHGDPNEEV